ncbi:hypothetical protein [Aromatoleum petrolei]|uniref:Uncharacterized protein n=1 Tax=Aromatoleum petrolei TaxID=76116 RepID=A0ABX1MW97_9RHOO|nr:hypothetical protein [Aromatoleum petrolei]NMF90596.1 hypothetical protein [Aromatoleum petrolei]QTQ37131.1 Uncharacterized protein ToN1_30010 [Aromatoleum petrolei]
MKRLALTGICMLAASGLLSSAAVAAGRQDKILEFDTMVGVSRPYTGSANPIRGVNGGGLPWAIGPVKGELTTQGKLEIRVTGLVFADDPAVPAQNRGKNTVPNFRAIVSCQTVNMQTDPPSAQVLNLTTGLFPATEEGNAYIEAQLDLPQPCLAPVIFVTNPNGAWFAATGM